MNFRARLKALEKPKQSSERRFRVISALADRWISQTPRVDGRPNGLLIDIVELDGGCADLSDQDLARFILSFPIKVGA